MTDKILNMLKKGEFVSGSRISSELGISRTAVWKYICKLRQRGYNIHSVTHKGYMLAPENDVLNHDDISLGLKTNYIGRNLYVYDDVVSTNLTAKENRDAPNGSVFAAEKQSCGRGRLGRKWESARGEGLWFSVLLKPDMPPWNVSLITLIAGLAVCKALGDGFYIKWPNDIVADGKKICGILTEMAAETDRVEYVVCGIGINVNNELFPDEIKQSASSVYMYRGVKNDRNCLLANVLNIFEKLYDEFIKDGFSVLRERYKKRCITIGNRVCAIGRDKDIEGIAEDITESGSLIINSGGNRTEVNSGEVSVRGIYGYV